MHILIIPSEHFMTEKMPLAGIFQCHQAKALARSGYRVGIVSIGFITLRHLARSYNYLIRERIGGIEIFRCYRRLVIPHRYGSIGYLKNKYISLFFQLFEKYVKQCGMPDVVHAHNFMFAGFIADELNRRYGIPYIVTEHSSQFGRGLLSNEVNCDLKKIATNAAFLTCVSKALKSILEQRLSSHFRVLPNVVDELFFQPVNVEKDNEYFNILNVASLDANKNQTILLRAFAAKFRGKKSTLTIVGEGPLETSLKELAGTLQIQSQVHFLGGQSPEKVRLEMAKAHCFVLSSNYETFGVVLTEALACGLPLVSTRSGGPADIVHDENGILVDVGSQRQLQDALVKMSRCHSTYSADSLRVDAKTRFSADEFVKRIGAYYEEARCHKSIADKI